MKSPLASPVCYEGLALMRPLDASDVFPRALEPYACVVILVEAEEFALVAIRDEGLELVHPVDVAYGAWNALLHALGKS